MDRIYKVKLRVLLLLHLLLLLKFCFAPQILRGRRSGGFTTAIHLVDEPCGALTGAFLHFGLGPLRLPRSYWYFQPLLLAVT